MTVSDFPETLSILEGTHITSLDQMAPRPVRLRAFHGTTQEFDTFHAKNFMHEGHFGQVVYFTSCIDDARCNYASSAGPDLQRKIENKAEILEDEFSTDVDMMDLDPEDLRRAAVQQAEDEFIGSVQDIHEVVLTLENPFMVGGEFAPRRLLFPELENIPTEARLKVMKDEGLDWDELEERMEEFEDFIFEAEDALLEEHVDRVNMAALRACQDLGCDAIDLIDLLGSIYEVTHADLDHLFRNNEKILYLENDDGTHLSCSLLSRTLMHLGFDSIILFHADLAFKSMGICPETTHIHILPGFESAIKPVALIRDDEQIYAEMAA